MGETLKGAYILMLIIRPETVEDVAAIRHTNEEAFGQPNDAKLVEKLSPSLKNRPEYYLRFLFDQENLTRLPLCFLFFLLIVSTKVSRSTVFLLLI